MIVFANTAFEHILFYLCHLACLLHKFAITMLLVANHWLILLCCRIMNVRLFVVSSSGRRVISWSGMRVLSWNNLLCIHSWVSDRWVNMVVHMPVLNHNPTTIHKLYYILNKIWSEWYNVIASSIYTNTARTAFTWHYFIKGQFWWSYTMTWIKEQMGQEYIVKA